MDVASRADLKNDLLKELDRYRAQFMATRATRHSESVLDDGILAGEHAHPQPAPTGW